MVCEETKYEYADRVLVGHLESRVYRPPLECPTCKFEGVQLGRNAATGALWAACVSCCGRRKDWEQWLTTQH